MVNNTTRHALDLADIEFLIRKDFNKLDFNLIKEYFHLFDQDRELDILLKRINNAQ